jgi:hypothetical protein
MMAKGNARVVDGACAGGGEERQDCWCRAPLACVFEFRAVPDSPYFDKNFNRREIRLKFDFTDGSAE